MEGSYDAPEESSQAACPCRDLVRVAPGGESLDVRP